MQHDLQPQETAETPERGPDLAFRNAVETLIAAMVITLRPYGSARLVAYAVDGLARHLDDLAELTQAEERLRRAEARRGAPPELPIVFRLPDLRTAGAVRSGAEVARRMASLYA
jgi:hypothetical protein